jgi:predicted aspartyl protease
MKLLSSRLIVAGIFLFPSDIGAQQNLATADAARANAIPFQLEAGFLIQVEGGIGQLEGLRFILDTGATHSVIDRRIANRFPLVLHPKRVFNFDRFVSVDWAEFPEVHLGPITMRNVSMIVTQLAKSSELVPDTDGIIGLDLLNTASKLSILYDSKMIVLKPREANVRAAELEGPFTVHATAQGHQIRLLLDTGMEGILLYEDRIRKQIPDLRLTDVRKHAHMGRLQGKTARLTGFRLGGPESDAEVFLIKGPRNDLFPDLDGYLGTASLKANRIELDFVSETLRWQ